MTWSYACQKLRQICASAKQLKTVPREDQARKAFLVAMDAFYQCLELLPIPVAEEARKVYDELNESLREESEQ